MNTRAYIYALLDPRDNSIRYIGKAVNVERRMRSHVSDKSDTHKARWVRELTRLGIKPKSIILADVPIGDWEWYERFYIALGHERGLRLVNGDLGGEGGVSYGDSNPMRRPDNIEAMHGDRNPMHHAGVADKFRGDNNPMRRPDVVAKVVAKRKGFPGKPNSQAAREKIGLASKKNNSVKNLHRPEVIAKILLTRKSEEYRERMSQSLKAYWERKHTDSDVARTLEAAAEVTRHLIGGAGVRVTA